MLCACGRKKQSVLRVAGPFALALAAAGVGPSLYGGIDGVLHSTFPPVLKADLHADSLAPLFSQVLQLVVVPALSEPLCRGDAVKTCLVVDGLVVAPRGSGIGIGIEIRRGCFRERGGRRRRHP